MDCAHQIPGLSLFPGVCLNSCPSSPWCDLILCCLLLLLPSIFPSIRVFSNKSALCIRWPKYWGFSFNISPSNEYSGLICFRIDWFDLLSFQATLKSLLQHHNSKASILWCSVFFTVQLSHPYITVGKPLPLSVLFNLHFLNIRKKKTHFSTYKGEFTYSSMNCLFLYCSLFYLVVGLLFCFRSYLFISEAALNVSNLFFLLSCFRILSVRHFTNIN